MAKKGAVGLRRVMRQLKRDAHKYEDCRIMWHAVKTKATGYGTAWLTRDECRAAINSMEHRQNHQVATGEGERLLWWSIDTREGE